MMTILATAENLDGEQKQFRFPGHWTTARRAARRALAKLMEADCVLAVTGPWVITDVRNGD